MTSDSLNQEAPISRQSAPLFGNTDKRRGTASIHAAPGPDTAARTGCARPAMSVAKNVTLAQEATALLRDNQTAGEFLAALIAAKRHLDALRFAAHALSTEDAIWWACLCLWEFYRPNPSADVTHVLETTVTWLQEPSDEHRREVDAAGKAAGVHTPSGSLATAVFFSGGSVSLPDLPEVAPKPDMAAKNAANAVLLACRSGAPVDNIHMQNHCLFLALEVARGELPCKDTETLVACSH